MNVIHHVEQKAKRKFINEIESDKEKEEPKMPEAIANSITQSDVSSYYSIGLENTIQFKEIRGSGVTLRAAHVGADIAELYHANSKTTRFGNVEEIMTSSWRVSDPSFLIPISHVGSFHLSTESVKLPNPESSETKLSDCLEARRSVRKFNMATISQSMISTLLYYSAGVTGYLTMKLQGSSVRKPLLAYPNAGGLQSVELFMGLKGIEKLPDGIYRYFAPTHLVEAVRKMSWNDLVRCIPMHPDIIDMSNASIIFLLVGRFLRTKLKYGQMGYKMTFLEAGHLAQNILLVSTSLGLGAVPLMGFYEDEIDKLLYLDGVSSSVIYIVCIGGLN